MTTAKRHQKFWTGSVKEKMIEQPLNKMSFETLIKTCILVNFGLSPCSKWQPFYYTPHKPTPPSLCYTPFKGECTALCFTRSCVVWSYLCWLTGTQNFPILNCKNFWAQSSFLCFSSNLSGKASHLPDLAVKS